jgi:hypothetical protein
VAGRAGAPGGERNLLLANKINNGTADEEDKEFAYFMHHESGSLIEVTIPIARPSTPGGLDLWRMNAETWKAQQLACFEAHQLDKKFNFQSRLPTDGEIPEGPIMSRKVL